MSNFVIFLSNLCFICITSYTTRKRKSRTDFSSTLRNNMSVKTDRFCWSLFIVSYIGTLSRLTSLGEDWLLYLSSSQEVRHYRLQDHQVSGENGRNKNKSFVKHLTYRKLESQQQQNRRGTKNNHWAFFFLIKVISWSWIWDFLFLNPNFLSLIQVSMAV